MTEIFYALIIFPMLFIIAMGFIYSSSLADINVQLVKLNCPYPINAATANVNLTGTSVEVYNITNDGNTDDYHVTVFTCMDANAGGLGPPTPQVNKITYTADTTNSWFDITNRASGYMFYISEVITTFFDKVVALGTLVVLFVQSPAAVLDIPQYTYVNAVLIAFMALGGFMVIRG